MKPKLSQALDPADTYEKVDKEALYEKYGKDKVDETIKYLTYKKEPKPLPKNENPSGPTLYVFRHGESEDNTHIVCSGWRDAPLTKKGVEDAQIIAEKLKNKEIHMLISSDQIRTYKTMEIVKNNNPMTKDQEIIVDRRLRERHYGDWQGKSKLIKQLEDAEGFKKARRGWDTSPPNGESISMVAERVDELLDEIVPHMKKYNINVAIACSGNSIRPIRKRFENLTEEEASHIETPTGKDYAAYPIN